MCTPPKHPSSDDCIHFLHQRLGAEIAARRKAMGLSAYALAKAAGVTDQTILNLERGAAANGCWTATLTRITLRLGTTASELLNAAERC